VTKKTRTFMRGFSLSGGERGILLHKTEAYRTRGL